MSKLNMLDTESPKEKALLVGVNLRRSEDLLSLEDSLQELELLADTAGVEVVGVETQNLDTPNSKTFIGKGKVEEVKILAGELDADMVIFDNELSPRHQRELENAFGESVRVIDRTALILDIFAQHAETSEGRLQVELAQYEYRLPRLTRAWTHLARQAGGGGGRTGSTGGVGLRGPGETQLEVDRRLITTRIEYLKNELEKVREHRMRHRERRKKTKIPVVALVGYTNAGKSTLLNRLSKSDVYVADQLFATLDPTTRRVELPGGQAVLFTDTVGFIQKLPTELVAAFRATLEEITEADVLLHVVDITHPNASAQAKSVQETLVDIGAGDIPVITAFNKVDLLKDPDTAIATLDSFPHTYPISAIAGIGLDELLVAIEDALYETYIELEVQIPYNEGKLISLFHEKGQVRSVAHEEKGAKMSGSLPRRLIHLYADYSLMPLILDEDEEGDLFEDEFGL
ncbi:MAG: GTPase HflX [Anaerolineaceae bacterium]|nr:GTPase HflX [Anaerolineaceae bacterium]